MFTIITYYVLHTAEPPGSECYVANPGGSAVKNLPAK